MTFTDLRGAVCDYCNLTSGEAQTRVGKAINRHYRRITASLGLDAARFVTRSASMTIGVGTVTFPEIEKIDRILDTSAATVRRIDETTINVLRSMQPGASAPCWWAFQNSDADSVTVLFDTVPQTAYSLQADGWTTLQDLTGNAEPVFPESYHDILVWFVISEELLKKEKDKLAGAYHAKATALLSELRYFLVDSHTRDLVQGSAPASALSMSGGGSGSANTGGTAYTQSALLTFDRGAGIVPFAIARTDAPYVVNLGAEFLGNVTSDRLLGRDTSLAGESEEISLTGGLEFTGSQSIRIADLGVTTAKLALLSVTTAIINDLAVTNAKIATAAAIARSKLDFGSGLVNADIAAAAAIAYSKLSLATSIVNADINASAAIDWSKVSKSGSSLADLATRSAGDLNSGTLLAARLPAGSIRQVVFGSTSTAVSSSSATFADTGLTATITPASASNKILVLVAQAGIRKTGANHMALKLLRAGSDLVQFESQMAFTNAVGENNVGAAALNYLDSPASTSALIYKTQFNSAAAGASTDVQHPSNTLSTIVLLEVVG